MRWISLGVLAAAGVLLALFWGEVPDRWVTHWGLHGPDGWATKSNMAIAMLPLLIGLITWLILEATAIWIEHAGRGKSVPREYLAVQAMVVRATGLGLSLLIAGITLALPFLRPRSGLPIVVAAIADLGLVVVGSSVWAARRTRQLRTAGVAIPNGYGSMFYKNPLDARLWVPKLVGPGWTINFGHRLAWPVMIALVGVPLVIVLVVLLVAR